MDNRKMAFVKWLAPWALVAAVGCLVGWSCWRPPDDRPKGLQVGPNGQPVWVPMTEEEAARPWDGKRFVPLKPR